MSAQKPTELIDLPPCAPLEDLHLVVEHLEAAAPELEVNEAARGEVRLLRRRRRHALPHFQFALHHLANLHV